MKFLSLLGQASGEYYSDPSTYDPSLYDTSYNTAANNAQLSDAAVAGMTAFILIFALVVIVLSYVISAFLLGRIFKKAGVEQWKAWVPVYNNWILLELGDQKGFWAVLALVPFVNIVSVVFMFIAMYNIGLKLGKESWFVLLAIFLPIVWLIWLAFDKSTWKGTVPAKTATANSAPTSSAAATPSVTPSVDTTAPDVKNDDSVKPNDSPKV
jgi:hypothetical protein